MTKPAPTSVRLPADLKASLQQLADADRRPLSSYIQLVLEDHVRARSGESPKPHGDKLAVPVGRAAGHRRKVTLGEPEDPDEQ
jgi:hypothetical protein